MSRRYQTSTASIGFTFDEYLRRLKSAPPRVALFLGEELFFFRSAVRELTRLVPEEFRAFNLGSFWMADDPLEAAVRMARELPFGGNTRLVLVRNLERCFKGKVSDEDENGNSEPSPALKELIAYLANPSPNSVLVLQAAKLDGRRKEVAVLKSKSVVVDCSPPDEAALAQWVRRRIKELNVSLDRRSESALVARLGNNLERLESELEKLSIYAGRGGSITPYDVERLVTTEAAFGEYALANAMLGCDARRALHVLHHELENGSFGTPLMLLGGIASSYRRLAMARAFQAGELPPAEVARISKVRPYNRFENTRHPHLRRMPERACARALKRIAEVDVAFKTSAATPALQLEHLVVELCDPAFWNANELTH